MMRKSKKTDLASKAEADASRLPAPRAGPDGFAELDRWFDELRNDFEQRLWGPIGQFGPEDDPATRWPVVDLQDNGSEFVLKAELPGVETEDLDIRVTPEGIEIGAETHGEREENEKGYVYRERSYSSFRRVLPLPDPVLAEKADTKLRDGVLEVRLPKKEPTPKREPAKVRVE